MRKKEKSKKKRNLVWLGLGVGAFLLHTLLGQNNKAVEVLYSRGIFSAFRWAWDYTLGFSPIPLVYVFTVFLIVWITVRIVRWAARRGSGTKKDWKQIFSRGCLSLLGSAGWAVFFFYILWGFNYNRFAVEKHLDLEIYPLTAAEVKAEAESAALFAAEARANIPDANAKSLGVGILPADLESELRRSLSGVLQSMGYPIPGRVRARRLWPGEVLMRFSSSGIYIPFFGEGYTADALLPFQIPFTLAHEMVHGFGFPDEGNANFLAYLACEASVVPVIKYSGRFVYWRHITREFSKVSAKQHRDFIKSIPPGIKADLSAVILNWRRFEGPLMEASQKVYNQYLKSQGIKEGVLSYNRLVVLVRAWKKTGKRINKGN